MSAFLWTILAFAVVRMLTNTLLLAGGTDGYTVERKHIAINLISNVAFGVWSAYLLLTH